MTSSRAFVVVSGLPGSGKTTLGRQIACELKLPLLDKDDILESQFLGAGEVDPETRQRLSRQSDELLKSMADATGGAVVVSFWRHPSLGGESGTPIDWLDNLGQRIVEVHCICPPAVAEARFRQRQRHPGHNDHKRFAELSSQLPTLAGLGPLGVGELISVRTDGSVKLDDVLSSVRRALASPDEPASR